MKITFWKSWAFVVILSGVLLWAGWAWGHRDGLLWSVPVVLGINYFLLIHSRWRILPLTNERPLEGSDGWNLSKSLQALCAEAQIQPPSVIVIDLPTPQAFLVGRLSRFSKIYVTQGFLDRLDAKEREAILATQVAALKMNLQFNFFVLGAFFDMVFWILSRIDSCLAWVVGARRKRRGSFTLWLLWPVLVAFQRLCLSPADYYKIDAMAADLCGGHEALCRALWKLESSSFTQPLEDLHPAWTHVFAVGPYPPRGPLGRLQPQPSAKRRIFELNGGFPI
jgi:Zn-dependent protease with chaperone function